MVVLLHWATLLASPARVRRAHSQPMRRMAGTERRRGRLRDGRQCRAERENVRKRTEMARSWFATYCFSLIVFDWGTNRASTSGAVTRRGVLRADFQARDHEQEPDELSPRQMQMRWKLPLGHSTCCHPLLYLIVALMPRRMYQRLCRVTLGKIQSNALATCWVFQLFVLPFLLKTQEAVPSQRCLQYSLYWLKNKGQNMSKLPRGADVDSNLAATTTWAVPE